MVIVILGFMVAIFATAGTFISIEAKRRKAMNPKQQASGRSGVGRAVSDQN